MKTLIKLSVVLTGAVLWFAGCSTMQTAELSPQTDVKNLNPRYMAGELAADVDGWVVLLDTSLSMNDTYQGYKKYDIARSFAGRMAQTLPDISTVSGLRTFGHIDNMPQKDTRLFYGISDFDRNRFMQGLQNAGRPRGMTPMAEAIESARSDLARVEGKKAIILISDGLATTEYKVLNSIETTQNMKDNDTCIYTVLVGDDPQGRQLMSKISQASGCGMMVSAMDTLPSDPMAGYVTDVFFREKQMQKTADIPHKPKEAFGLGYTKPEKMMRPLQGVHFRFDQHDLTQAGESVLDQNIEVLKENPDLKVVVEGHTSAKGPDTYNMQLSQKRAKSVKHYLVQEGKIASERISTVGYGETQPKVLEPYPEKALSSEAQTNMRVELKVRKIEQMNN